MVGNPRGVIQQHTGGGDLAADALGDGGPVFGGKGGGGGGIGLGFADVFALGFAEAHFVCFNFVEVCGFQAA